MRRVLDPRANLVGTQPEAYGLPQGERLNEVITQSWNRLRKHWTEFRTAASNLPEGEPGTGLTNDRWSLPLLRELGFGVLQTTPAPEISGRTYAINRFFGPVPIHLVGCGLSLDRRAAGVRGAAELNPHGLVQELLNRSPEHKWAIVSNGLCLRVLRDNEALSRQSFLEFDLQAMFDGEIFSDFVLLWLMVHATRFAPRQTSEPDSCWLGDWTKIADEQGTRALGELRAGVEKALQILGESFTGHTKNSALRDALRTGTVSPAELHAQLLRVVYRLIFLFVTEDRDLDGQPLLHPRDESNAARTARDRFTTHYGTVRLRDLAGKIKGSRHTDLWRQFQLLVGPLSGEEQFSSVRERLSLPALGGFLWSPSSTAMLNDAELANHDLLEALRNLAFTRQGKVLRPVDYKNLGAEELGGIYESLLGLTPQITADGARFTFAEFAGSERKTSGSYYTPDSLVQCLLDSALDPVVDEAIRGKTGADAERAILELKVCDPAVGSGHFLVGAAHRLARHLARVRAQSRGESEPSPLFFQHALRDVIGRCLYGVDINPMAAELCRVSLWLEAVEPGKPLSFLDHHIRVGNSLLGATPDLIAVGLPDEAFTAIEGDDTKVCSALRKRNRQEREGGQQDMLHLMVAEPATEYNAITSRRRGIDEVPDDTIDGVKLKTEQFRRLVVSPDYLHSQQVADSWCAAFVWKKVAGADVLPITTDTIKRLEEDPAALSKNQRTEVERLSSQFQFFHWHLAFPEVFAKGGFDCVLGNPPWERVKIQEKEWFAERSPGIASAPNAVARKRLIDALEVEDPALYGQFIDDLRQAEGESHFIRNSGRYPLCGRGDINTYAAFAEGMRKLLTPIGRVGCVLPTGIATDDTTKFFFQDLVGKKSLFSLYSFENEEFVFPNIHHATRFCLFTAGLGERSIAVSAEYVFFARQVQHLRDVERRFTLTADDILLLNPNTHTCPIFRSRHDAELTKAIYRRVPILIREVHDDQSVSNPWGIKFTAMFHMANDSHLFRSRKQLETEGWRLEGNCFRKGGYVYLPLYEAKMIHHFDHRWGTYEGQTEAQANQGKLPELDQSMHANPMLVAMSRYWTEGSSVDRAINESWRHSWLIGFRDITGATVVRTVIACVMPRVAVGHTCPVIFSGLASADLSLFVAALGSFALDFSARQKIGGSHLTYGYFNQLPIHPPDVYTRPCPWSSTAGFLHDWFLPRVLELTYTAWDLESFAQDCRWTGPPFCWDEERRFLLRCELDAAFFHLYFQSGPQGEWEKASRETEDNLAQLKLSFQKPRDAVAYVMDTFPIVRQRDEEKHNGDYRTKRVILEIYDEMAEAIRTGVPYRTRLDPPPADAACRHPKLALGILAFGSLIGDPGVELEKLIKFRLKTVTPFPVEFGRYSKKRGGAPTLVKHDAGAPVTAEILVLDDSILLEEARDMLWRRERRREGSGEKYKEGTSADSVLVREMKDSPIVSSLLYADFNPEGKVLAPSAIELAAHAIESAKKAESKKDGITYLSDAMAAGIRTPLTEAYREAILEQTGARSLAEALRIAKVGNTRK
jgi:hypothetical protein